MNHQNHYLKPAVQFAIIPYLKNRETAFLVHHSFGPEEERKSTRWKRCHSTQNLYTGLRVAGYFDKQTPYNIYSSLATYRYGIPLKNGDPDKSPYKITFEEFKEDYWKYITSFDCLIDLDSPDHSEGCMEAAHESFIAIHKFLKKCFCPHYCRFSGKGFHIIIPYEAFPPLSFDPQNKQNIYKLYAKLCKYFYNNYSEMVDFSINDSKRVVKVPYSLAQYSHETYLCRPLFEEEIETFKLSDFLYYDSMHISLRKENLYCKTGNAIVLLYETKTWEQPNKNS